MKKEKVLIYLSIINMVLLLLIIVLNVSTGEKSTNVVSNNQDAYKKELLKKENFVFLGDSITDWYPFEELYEDMPIVNSGVAGYKTQDVLKNLKSMIYDYNPTKVFILIGTNDLNDKNITEETTYENIKKIISNIKENRPEAEIYLQSIYPINNTDNDKIKKDTVGIRTNKDIISLNNKLEDYCNKNDVTYINMYDNLLDEDKNLKIKYTDDGLHLSGLGYIKVTRILLPYLEN